MRKLVKWIALALGACVVLGIVGAALGGGKGTPTPTSAPVARQAATSVPVSLQPTAQPAAATGTPTAAPTIRPSAAPATVPPAPTAAPVATNAPARAPASGPTPSPVEQALWNHFKTTGCAPEINSAWCSHLKAVYVTGNLVQLETDLTEKNPEDLRLMLQVTSAFVFNNENKHYGLNVIAAVSSMDKRALAIRNGLAGQIVIATPSSK